MIASEQLFYAGIVGMVVVVVGAAIATAVLLVFRYRVSRRLDEEYGCWKEQPKR